MVDTVCSFTYEQYCEKVESFHGHLAPGVIIAGFMVDLASRSLPPHTLFDVICETAACLPDAITLLTPCSVGNQWLKIIDVGRFAMTLYDKDTGEGVRVFLDPGKLDSWPVIKDWFLKLKPKEQQDRQVLFSQIRDAGTGICGIERVKISREFLRGWTGKSVAVCPVCHEAYRFEDGSICPACKEKRLPYTFEAERVIKGKN
jgi:formylmethanofuran dehydrogenase subunit E